MKGTVKRFYSEKGYGFITTKDEPGDIFFHYSEIVSDGYKSVADGASVEFTLDYNERGKYAKGIVKL
jgi:CspA family cold shock protein